MDLNIHEDFFQVSEKSQIQAQFHGDSASDLLIILPKETPHIDLIEKIMKAINIQDLNQVNQLHLSHQDHISLYPLLEDSKVERVISFGFPSTQIGIHVDHRIYQTAAFQAIQFIFTSDLDTVSTNADHKKALWGALKQWV